MSVIDSPQLDTPVNGAAVLSRVSRRLIPFLFLLYIINYMDRTNISFTKESMQADLHLNDQQYGFAASIFFFGYVLLEVPSNLTLHRFGARRWLARIVISWGLVAASMALVRGRTSLSFARLLLGITEAGFAPGVLLYMTYWFPARERAKAFGLFLASIALAGVVGSPLSVFLLRMDGILHLHGWQWVFLLEGLACLPLGMFTLFWLTDRPRDARWLKPHEAQWLEEQLRAEVATSHHGVSDFVRACLDRRVLLLVIQYFTLISGLFGFIYWAPSLMIDHTGGWLKAIPFAVAAIMMSIIGHHSDRTRERRWHVAICALVGAIGMAATARYANTWMAIVTLSVAAIGIWGTLGPFWALPASFLHDKAAAGGIAAVNAFGCTAGIVTPWAIGAIRQHGGGYAGLYLVSGALVIGAMLILFVRIPQDTN